MLKIDATSTTATTEAPDYFGVNARYGVRKPQQRAIPTVSVENDKETALLFRLSAIALFVSTMGYIYFSCFAHGIAVVG